MQYKNDGKSEEHYIQNRFTAYLQVSLRRKRIEVLAKRYDLMRHETATETNELFLMGSRMKISLFMTWKYRQSANRFFRLCRI